MVYVEEEAQRRVRKIKRPETEAYSLLILKVLRETKKPRSTDLISFLTGIDKPECCRILEKLEKEWKLVRKVTASKTGYYKAC